MTEPTAGKRRRRKEARPAELIEAGLAEFTEKGFAAARLDDVAHRAGVAKGTIYRYFDSKEALFLAAIRSRVTPVLGGIEAMVDGYPGTTRELLEHLFRAFYDRVLTSEAPVLMRIIIAEGQRFPDIPAEYHREIITRGQRLLRRILERGVARGEVRSGPVLDAPMVLIAPVIMTAIWRLTFEAAQPIDIERVFRAHADLVFNGLLLPARDHA
jgi:AcrR family transcriptional regulator